MSYIVKVCTTNSRHEVYSKAFDDIVEVRKEIEILKHKHNGDASPKKIETYRVELVAVIALEN